MDDTKQNGGDAADHEPSEVDNPTGGEDEGGASQDGRDDHLKDDQKPTTK